MEKEMGLNHSSLGKSFPENFTFPRMYSASFLYSLI